MRFDQNGTRLASDNFTGATLSGFKTVTLMSTPRWANFGSIGSVFLASSTVYARGDTATGHPGTLNLMVKSGTLPMTKDNWTQHPARTTNDLAVNMGYSLANDIGIEANMDQIKNDGTGSLLMAKLEVAYTSADYELRVCGNFEIPTG
jgi:hypothetical protein